MTRKTSNPADLQQQVSELTEALQRERADAMNLRRRHDEQVANLTTVVKANLVRELLPIIDNFERAMQHAPKQTEEDKWVEGVNSILKQFGQTLTSLGVERIKTVGEIFDPRYHEAVSMEEGEGTTEVVSEELQAGYRLGDEVIRHAMVKVKLEDK